MILGAGLTGLSAGYHLEKNGFYNYKIFEKESQIGGLCKSAYQDGFTFDYTGHLLHISDPYFKNLIEDIFGFNNLNKIIRKSFIYSHNTYTPYPYQINLHGLPSEVIADCIEGFVTRNTKHHKANKTKKAHSYYQWVLKNFGAGLGKHFFFPYQQKIFDYDVRKITDNWTGRFVPKTSLRKIIEGSICQNKENTQEKIGYNSQFFYPKKQGIFSWVKKLAQKLYNPIHTNFCAQEINMRNKTITFKNGHIEPFETLITTLPLDILLKSLKEPASLSLKNKSSKLLCNSVVNFNLGIFSPQNFDKHWIYFPETQYPFYRMGFYHNFSAAMAPKGCSALYGEFSYVKKSKKFVQEKLEHSLKHAKKLLKINNNDILTQKIITIPRAYVIYDFWRDTHINSIHKRLNEQSIHSIGRYGQWKYSSMQEAIFDGKLAVEKIIDKLIFDKDKKYWHIIPELEAHHGPLGRDPENNSR